MMAFGGWGLEASHHECQRGMKLALNVTLYKYFTRERLTYPLNLSDKQVEKTNTDWSEACCRRGYPWPQQVLSPPHSSSGFSRYSVLSLPGIVSRPFLDKSFEKCLTAFGGSCSESVTNFPICALSSVVYSLHGSRSKYFSKVAILGLYQLDKKCMLPKEEFKSFDWRLYVCRPLQLSGMDSTVKLHSVSKHKFSWGSWVCLLDSSVLCLYLLGKALVAMVIVQVSCWQGGEVFSVWNSISRMLAVFIGCLSPAAEKPMTASWRILCVILQSSLWWQYTTPRVVQYFVCRTDMHIVAVVAGCRNALLALGGLA